VSPASVRRNPFSIDFMDGTASAAFSELRGTTERRI